MDERYHCYSVVSTKAELANILAGIGSGVCALDFETTSLSPAHGKVRLVSLYDGAAAAVVDFDRIPGGFRACAKMFERGEWLVFNSGFELRWFKAAGVMPRCRDVAYLRCAVHGGGRYSLKNLVAWDLEREMDKTEQVSDWAAPELTQSQRDYAFRDAVETWDLYQHWLSRAGKPHLRAWQMFDDMVPAVIEMEDSGMLLDVKRHRELISLWEDVQQKKVQAIRSAISEDMVANINSDSQWSDFFGAALPDHVVSGWPRTEKAGQLSMTSEVLRNVGAQFFNACGANPVTSLLDDIADYKKVSKYLSSFGESLLHKAEAAPDKRVRARFNIAAAKTCRFSSSGPNLQQIPRDNVLLGVKTSVRQSFCTGLGRKLVSLDYSGIELRVLALLSGDDQLLQDVVYGDVHSEVASVIAGERIDKSTPEGKAARTAAKAVSFGIIYGSSAPGLSATMRTSTTKAQDYINFWSERYPQAFTYRHTMLEEARNTRHIRCVDGGTIYMGWDPDLPKCANYPVQRAALSVMAHAIARHKRTLDEERAAGRQRMTRLLSTIHDALIDEASSREAQACLLLMQQDMVAGYLDVFPNAPTERLVEGGIGTNWGNLE